MVARVIVAVLFLLVGLVGVVPSAGADHGGPIHVVCAQVWYETPPGSSPQYLVNECRLATDWQEATGSGPKCVTYETTIRVCWWVEVRTPV